MILGVSEVGTLRFAPAASHFRRAEDEPRDPNRADGQGHPSLGFRV